MCDCQSKVLKYLLLCILHSLSNCRCCCCCYISNVRIQLAYKIIHSLTHLNIHTHIHFISRTVSVYIVERETTCLWRFVWYVQHIHTHTSTYGLFEPSTAVCVYCVHLCLLQHQLKYTIQFHFIVWIHQVNATLMYTDTHKDTNTCMIPIHRAWSFVRSLRLWQQNRVRACVFAYASCLWFICFIRSLILGPYMPH